MPNTLVLYLFLLFVLFASGCKKDALPQQNALEKTSILSSPEGNKLDTRTQLIIKRTPVRLRETAGVNGKVIRELKYGTVLYDLGEVSNYTSRIELRGNNLS